MRTNLKAANGNEKRILDYIEENASEMLVEKINNSEKTLSGCWKFIVSEARKEAKNGCACIEDQKVFGWAMHYFEEDSITEAEKKVANDAKEEKKVEAESKKTEPKPERKEKPNLDQMTIFDFGFQG